MLLKGIHPFLYFTTFSRGPVLSPTTYPHVCFSQELSSAQLNSTQRGLETRSLSGLRERM